MKKKEKLGKLKKNHFEKKKKKKRKSQGKKKLCVWGTVFS